MVNAKEGSNVARETGVVDGIVLRQSTNAAALRHIFDEITKMRATLRFISAAATCLEVKAVWRCYRANEHCSICGAAQPYLNAGVIR